MKGKLAVVDQGQELIGGYTNDVEKSYSGALPIVILVITHGASSLSIFRLLKALME